MGRKHYAFHPAVSSMIGRAEAIERNTTLIPEATESSPLRYRTTLLRKKLLPCRNAPAIHRTFTCKKMSLAKKFRSNWNQETQCTFLSRVISKGVPLQGVSGTEMQYFLRSKSHSNRSFYTPIDRKRFKLELCIFTRKKVMTVFLEKHLFRVPAAVTFQEGF